MANWTGIGKDLIKEGVFERFPELIPAVGEPNYWKGEHSKLLLVGESNYFEDKFESISDFKEPNKWYFGGKDRLIPPEKIDFVNNWVGSRGHNNIFKSIKTVLDEEGIINYNSYLLQEAAYYNYFLRPASEKDKNGKKNLGFEKNCKQIDCEVAYSALCGIIEVIKPDIVIFVSKFAWGKFEEYRKMGNKQFENVSIDYVNHFSRACWNDENGKKRFENLLREFCWVKKKPNFQKLQIIHNLLLGKFQEEEIYNSSDCGIWKKNYLSCLYFRVKDSSFCCETGVKIDGIDFWTCFYKTENSKDIPSLDGKDIKILPDISTDKIVVEIEKQIREIIEEVSKT